MKKFLVLSAVLSASALASTIGACVPGALRGYVGNPCSLGDRVFESFADRGDDAVSRVNVHFEMAAPQFRIFLEPLTGASFFTAQPFADPIAMQAGAAPNIPPANLPQGPSNQLVLANNPGPADTLVPDTEAGGPTFFAPTNSIVTTSTVTGPGGTGAASLELSSFELGADNVVPEPASFALVGGGLLCLGLLRKRTA